MKNLPHMLAFAVLLQMSLLAQSDKCSAVTDCLDCLEGGCFWTTTKKCMEDGANITESHVGWYSPDTTPYSPFEAEGTPERLCGAEAQAQDQENIKMCRSQTNCTACKATQTNRTHTALAFGRYCNWFIEAGYCSLFHDNPGANGERSARFCPDTPEGICFDARGSNCETCLQAQPYPDAPIVGCTWLGKSCVVGCPDWLPDSSYCFSREQMPASPLPEICQLADYFYADKAICEDDEPGEAMTTCQICTSRIKSDGSPCLWILFEGEDESDGRCASGEGLVETALGGVVSASTVSYAYPPCESSAHKDNSIEFETNGGGASEGSAASDSATSAAIHHVFPLLIIFTVGV